MAQFTSLEMGGEGMAEGGEEGGEAGGEAHMLSKTSKGLQSIGYVFLPHQQNIWEQRHLTQKQNSSGGSSGQASLNAWEREELKRLNSSRDKHREFQFACCDAVGAKEQARTLHSSLFLYGHVLHPNDQKFLVWDTLSHKVLTMMGMGARQVLLWVWAGVWAGVLAVLRKRSGKSTLSPESGL